MTTLSAIMNERRHLLNLAYRMLGSLADAEDVVQETYTRWYAMSRAQQEAVESPGAWLTTVASRFCLNLLGSARDLRRRVDPGAAARRDRVDRRVSGRRRRRPGRPDHPRRVGDHGLPGRVRVNDPGRAGRLRAARRLPLPVRRGGRDRRPQRGGVPSAGVLGPPPYRRRASRGEPGRRRAGERRPAVKAAWEAQDIEALLGLLDPGATAISDGGGRAIAHLLPIEGAQQIADLYLTIARLAPPRTMLERTVNGLAGLAIESEGRIDTVFAFEVADDDRITHIWTVRNPDKLRPWQSL